MPYVGGQGKDNRADVPIFILLPPLRSANTVVTPDIHPKSHDPEMFTNEPV